MKFGFEETRRKFIRAAELMFDPPKSKWGLNCEWRTDFDGACVALAEVHESTLLFARMFKADANHPNSVYWMGPPNTHTRGYDSAQEAALRDRRVWALLIAAEAYEDFL